jgi:hypothetical protein
MLWANQAVALAAVLLLACSVPAPTSALQIDKLIKQNIGRYDEDNDFGSVSSRFCFHRFFVRTSCTCGRVVPVVSYPCIR